jgi:hypothetical protein
VKIGDDEMTREQFKKELSSGAGQLTIKTDKYVGMIGISPSNILIWVDDPDFWGPASARNIDGPRNIGEFRDADELLNEFEVDGRKFADSVLPEIKKLIVVIT